MSGFAALVYQVVWQRLLALHSGVGIYSVALIVSAFMAGLGLGSLAGGSSSARLSPERALHAFAWLELGIGLFGAVSSRLYYDVLYLGGWASRASDWRAGLGHFAALVVPTTLMGMSLPCLVRALVREASGAAHTIGLLYGANVLGASAGALLTPWVLMRWLGCDGAVGVAAAGNLAAGLGALLLARGTALHETGRPAREVEPPLDDEPRHPFALWLGLYAFSGFCALALEVLWFRLMDVAVKSSAFTFGSMLSLYLLGSGAGSLIGARRAPRLRRPLRAFLSCQCLILILAGLPLVVLDRAPTAWLRTLLEFFQACARHLKPGGVVCTWAPTNRVYATFAHALPHVLALDEGRLLIGSQAPQRLEVATWRARLEAPPVAAYLGEQLAADVRQALEHSTLGRPKARRREDLNLDLHPRDELLVP